MIMKRYIAIAACLIFGALTLGAQTLEEGGDVVEVNAEVQEDASLADRSIFDSMPGTVSVNQSAKLRSAVARQVENNSRKQFTGYRIRIFFSNSQNAREESISVLKRFQDSHPTIPAYRSYTSPNFKVTVGNFRTRSDAEAILPDLQLEFPAAFIVREKFKYPSIGRPATTVDSLKVVTF